MFEENEEVWFSSTDFEDSVEVGDDIGGGLISDPLELFGGWIGDEVEGVGEFPGGVAVRVGVGGMVLGVAYELVL